MVSANRVFVAVTAAMSALGSAALALWFVDAPTVDLNPRVPHDHPRRRVQVETVDIKGRFQSFGKDAPAAAAGSWPRFRGADSDNVDKAQVRLADKWPEGGPPVVWTKTLGEGHAGAAVHRGRMYVLDYDEEEKADALRCFAFSDGRELWRRSYKVRIPRYHGISRTVPAVTDRYVVTIGPKCHVMCVDAETGEFRWGIDLPKEYGTAVPLWYTGQCPLIDNGVAVLAPGGRALLAGIDCETGKQVWETPNTKGRQMSHSSVMPAAIAGRRMYIYAALGGTVGVAADGPDRGKILWEFDEWNHSVIAPSPVALDDGRVFLTAGYGVGSAMIQVTASGGAYSVQPILKLDKNVFACDQHSPVFYQGRLFGVLPESGGANNKMLACIQPDGRPVWTSGKDRRFGKGLGPFVIADGKIFVLGDDGMLTMARAASDGYVELGRAQVLPEAVDAWGPIAVVNGMMVMRELKRMVCLDMRAEEEKKPAVAAGER
jgi:outer membrane protein assembly factor BamB